MKDKCVLVGISGGIAAFKICSLVSSLKKKGNDVHVLMTKEAEQFVTPLTLQTLSGNRVIRDLFSLDEGVLHLYFPDYAFGYRGWTDVPIPYTVLSEAGVLADWVTA